MFLLKRSGLISGYMTKKTLVILPGWGGSHETWKEFMTLAQDDFTVVCVDLPCFGTEPCPQTVWGIEEYADFVVKKLRKIGHPVILLGHSFGGQVAAYIAAHHPDVVDKLILSGAAVLRPKNRLRRAVFFAIAKCGKLIFALPIIERFDVLAKKILYRGADSPDYAETSGIKRDIFRKIIRQDLRRLLSHISVPTLLLWGSADAYVAVSAGRKIHTLIKGSVLHIIKDGTHGLHLTHKEKMISHIKTFVSA